MNVLDRRIGARHKRAVDDRSNYRRIIADSFCPRPTALEHPPNDVELGAVAEWSMWMKCVARRTRLDGAATASGHVRFSSRARTPSGKTSGVSFHAIGIACRTSSSVVPRTNLH